MDANGNAIAVWLQTDSDGDFLYANRFVDGAGWGTAERIAADAFDPSIAMDPNGNAIVVWDRFDISITNVFANRFTVSGGWEAAQLIETDDTGDAFDANVAMDANGNAIAVWSQFDGTLINIVANRFDVNTGWGTPASSGATRPPHYQSSRKSR